MSTAYVLLTDQCNLRCKYCFQDGKAAPHPAKKRKISREILDRYVDYCANNDVSNAEIFGGEPLFYRDVFEYAVKTLRARMPSLQIGVVTNGTLINERIMSLIERERVNVLVSIDGKKSRHDEMRGGFDRIGKWFARLAALDTITVALQAGRIDELYDHIKYLWDAGFKKGVFVNVIYNYGWYVADDVRRFEVEYEQALLGMLRGEGKLLCALRLHDLLQQASGFQICGLIAKGLACNWDGTFYPCIRAVELGSAFAIGDVYSGIDEAKNRDIRARISEEVLSSPCAERHPMVSFCPIATYQEQGTFGGKWNEQYCDIIDIKAKLVAKYYHEITNFVSDSAKAA